MTILITECTREGNGSHRSAHRAEPSNTRVPTPHDLTRRGPLPSCPLPVPWGGIEQSPCPRHAPPGYWQNESCPGQNQDMRCLKPHLLFCQILSTCSRTGDVSVICDWVCFYINHWRWFESLKYYFTFSLFCHFFLPLLFGVQPR